MDRTHFEMSENYDVVIIGGGPGGATVGALVAERGYRALVLEKEQFPRFSIGESLIPETYWTFHRLGVLDKLRESAYPRKFSVKFVSPSGRESQPFYFFQTNPHESSVTWQVLRADFDKMMLDNARAKGAEVRQGALVKEVLFEGDRAVGVRVQENGSEKEMYCKVVVDSSGRNSFLARRLGLVRQDPGLRKASIFAHFENGARDSNIDEGATLIIYARRRGTWFWYIPLPENRVSVGVVSAPQVLFEGRQGDPARVFEEEIEMCPGIKERLENASRVTDARVLSDYSYKARQVAGDGWVLVGDAYGFLDPIYSSGVFLALKMGEYAADAIHDAFQKNDFSGHLLGNFEPELKTGMEAMRKLVYAFYAPEFSFRRFIEEHPEFRKHLVDLLVGDIFKKEIHEIFEVMSDYCDLPEPMQA